MFPLLQQSNASCLRDDDLPTSDWQIGTGDLRLTFTLALLCVRTEGHLIVNPLYFTQVTFPAMSNHDQFGSTIDAYCGLSWYGEMRDGAALDLAASTVGELGRRYTSTLDDRTAQPQLHCANAEPGMGPSTASRLYASSGTLMEAKQGGIVDPVAWAAKQSINPAPPHLPLLPKPRPQARRQQLRRWGHVPRA
jgi:hypothetical protein